MNKAMHLITTSVLALLAGGAFAPPAASAKTAPHATSRILYNQNSNAAGNSVESMNFTSGTSYSAYNSQAADDFVVPKGQTWTIREVDVSGQFIGGSGPATSENVVFFKNGKAMPGPRIRNGAFRALNGTARRGDFEIALPGKGVTLRSGTYWVSVVANMFYQTNGEWNWDTNGTQHGSQAVWQNPHGGTGVCPSWGTIENCQNTGAPDVMFDLKGTSQGG